MGTETARLLTPAEYLAFERQSELRHEYVAGEVRALIGGNRAHSLILVNAAAALNEQLRPHACDVFMVTMRVKIAALGIYTYPDLAVVCGESELEDREQDTLLNPVFLAEVLSPATAAYDRTLKFRRYQLIPSLRDYLLIAQDAPRVEHHTLGTDGNWRLHVYSALHTVVDLAAIGCRLPLAEIYARITF
jgi:Uma2 family endonuclease